MTRDELQVSSEAVRAPRPSATCLSGMPTPPSGAHCRGPTTRFGSSRPSGSSSAIGLGWIPSLTRAPRSSGWGIGTS